LEERQKESGIEVVNIDVWAGSVELLLDGVTTNRPVLIRLPGQVPNPGILLENAGLEPVLELYQEFTGRTLLRWPQLPAAISFTLIAPVSSAAQAATVLEKVLSTNQIAAIPDGSKFLMVVPTSRAATITPRSAELHLPVRLSEKSPRLQRVTASDQTANQEPMPAGVINFPKTPIRHVAIVYAGLLRRKFDEKTVPADAVGTISLRFETPLWEAEACYALETLFSWQGLKLVPIGSDLSKLVRISDSDPGR